MPENDSTPGAPKRKAKKVPAVPPEIQPPLIEAGQVYWRQDFLKRLKMTERTFKRWTDAGFRAPRPGLKQGVVIADDAIEFMRQHPDLVGEDDE